MRKKKTTKKSLVVVLVLGLVILLSLALYLINKKVQQPSLPNNKQMSSLSDEDTISDLYVLENEIILYSEKETKGVGAKLPDRLEDVDPQELKGKLSDYEYNPIQQTTGGGPTIIYRICAVFNSHNSKLDDPYYSPDITYNGPKAYEYHNTGKQCFINSYYKGQSHISLESE